MTPQEFAPTSTNPVAALGSTEFENLQDAFNAAPDGVKTTITILRDFVVTDVATVASDKNIVLDMAGHSITVTEDFEGRPITNTGTLLVTGNGTIDSSASYYGGYGAIRNDGVELTIENGRFVGHVEADGSAIRNGKNAKLTVNGGYFIGTNAVYNQGEAYISGGEFETTGCSGCETYWGYALYNDKGCLELRPANNDNVKIHATQGAISSSNGSRVFIGGGTFYSEPCENDHIENTFYAVYVSGRADNESVCIIDDGVFYTNGENACIYVQNTDTSDNGGTPGKAVLEINGGSFSAGSNGADLFRYNAVNGSTLTITSGRFEGTTKEVLQPFAPDTCIGERDRVVSVAKNHLYTWEVVQAPTASSPGTQHEKCSNCDDAKPAVDLATTSALIPVVANRVEQIKPAQEMLASIIQAIRNATLTDFNSVSLDTAQKIKNLTTGDQDSLSAEAVVTPLDKEAVNTEESSKVAELLASRDVATKYGVATKVGTYFDVKILLKSNGKQIGTLNQLSKPMKFTIAVPEELRGGAKRTFFVVRVHNGSAARIDNVKKLSNGIIEFESDKFSTYALAYTDSMPVEKPGGTTSQTVPVTNKKPGTSGTGGAGGTGAGAGSGSGLGTGSGGAQSRDSDTSTSTINSSSSNNSASTQTIDANSNSSNSKISNQSTNIKMSSKEGTETENNENPLASPLIKAMTSGEGIVVGAVVLIVALAGLLCLILGRRDRDRYDY